MMQHWHVKHNQESRRSIIQHNTELLTLLGSRVEEAKRQKLAEDQELLQRQQDEKHKLYDEEERKTKDALTVRDIANAEKLEREKLHEEQTRAEYDKAAEELQLRQTRQITVASLEWEMQEELRELIRLLQSVPHEVVLHAQRRCMQPFICIL
jgi:hypothetical protein